MPRSKAAAIPAAPRKFLSEWIEFDDGNTTGPAQPGCTRQARALHARIVLEPEDGKSEAREPLQPSPGLRLPPLG